MYTMMAASLTLQLLLSALWLCRASGDTWNFLAVRYVCTFYGSEKPASRHVDLARLIRVDAMLTKKIRVDAMLTKKACGCI